MKRCSNWPALLAQFIADRTARPFDWATGNNCAFFACDWIVTLTGVDLASDFRADVTSALAAQRVLAARGGIEQLADDACARWNWPSCEVKLARRGDVVSIASPHGTAIGICLGLRSAFCGGDGLLFVETVMCLKAWRIA